MTRLTESRYRLWIFGLMAIYVALVFALLPTAKHAASIALRAGLGLAIAAPVVAVIGVMVWRVMSSDELQQRLHMLALSVATGLVAAVSLVAGFLQVVQVLHLDGDILIWVFPSLCFCYGLARIGFNRRFGGRGCEE